MYEAHIPCLLNKIRQPTRQGTTEMATQDTERVSDSRREDGRKTQASREEKKR
jgi:hypothetical protein